MSIRYEAVLGHPNTTSLDVMVDEHVAFDPVRRDHEYRDVPPFEVRAYSVEEIFAEKLRAIFQRGAARDYYDLYHLLQTDSVGLDIDAILPAFEAKCDHDNLDVDVAAGLPADHRADVERQWETTLPDLTRELPAFDDVWTQIEAFVTSNESN